MKKYNKYFIVIIFVLAFLLIIINIFPEKAFQRKTIINNFKDNKNDFQNSFYELTNDDHIYFNNENNEIYIKFHYYEGENVVVKNLKQSDYKKYKNTINLMKRLNLDKVSKEYGNISFQFDSKINLSKKVVYLINQEKYNWAYNVLYTKNIYDNWYYIETK